MIELGEHADGVVLPVRAQPRAKRNAIPGAHHGALKVAVTAPPEDGRANAALVAVIAKSLRVKRSQVELLSGQTSRDKSFLIVGVDRDDVAQRLAALLSDH